MESYPSYRAPRGDGEKFIVPPAAEVVRALTETLPQDSPQQLWDRRLAAVRAEARRDLLHAAERYTRSYCDVDASCDGPLIFTGHQPEMVHPGVWLKNFLASALAEHSGGLALNLLIDGDLCARPAISVPAGGVDAPQLVSVPFDEPLPPTPYEERGIKDASTWQTFADRVGDVLADWAPDPFVKSWWPEVVNRGQGEPILGRRLAQARHRVELDWGSKSLEAPQSLICTLPAFRWFAAHLCLDAERFQATYNRALHDYRLAHRIRNLAQPLPDLTAESGWIETPLWTWNKSLPRRRPLYAARRDRLLHLSDRDGISVQVEATAARVAEAFEQWEQEGVKVRSRALLTTLFARLLLCDVFVHGIGGGKYDQVTDAIARETLGIGLPDFVVASGTLRLRNREAADKFGRPQAIRQRIREMTFHPEVWVDEANLKNEQVHAFRAANLAKQAALQLPRNAQTAVQKHAQIEQANTQLRYLLQGEFRSAEAALLAAEQHERAARILDHREYAFCLFSRERLQDFLLEMSGVIA